MVSCSLCHAFFANSSLILCCLIINLLLFFLTKVALCLLLYICHLGPCFGSGHCGPFGNPTLVDFIWAVGSPSGSLGFDYGMECPVRAVGHWATCPLWYWFLSLYYVILTYLHLFVLMIVQLLYKNFVCMAIKIFWLDLTWLFCTCLSLYCLFMGADAETC